MESDNKPDHIERIPCASCQQQYIVFDMLLSYLAESEQVLGKWVFGIIESSTRLLVYDRFLGDIIQRWI